MGKYRYYCSGNIMTDQVMQPDGTLSDVHLGGPSVFAYAGVKLYDDNCCILANAGLDFDEIYGDWIRANNVDTSQIWRMVEHTHASVLVYHEDGSYEPGRPHSPLNFGLCESNGKRFGLACDENSVLYYPHDTFNWASWLNIWEAMEQKHFKFMWEIHANSCIPEQLDRIIKVLPTVDMFSINYNEMKTLLGSSTTEEEAIRWLQKYFGKFCILRVGSRGLYAIEADKATLIPSINSEIAVDSTGCGNCSTGAAMYGWMETGDAIMAGIMANIAAGYNVRQYGPYPKFTEKDREDSFRLAAELRKNYD